MSTDHAMTNNKRARKTVKRVGLYLDPREWTKIREWAKQEGYDNIPDGTVARLFILSTFRKAEAALETQKSARD
jgi:hypothetical protein